MSNKVYEIITDRIIQSLQNGVVPWRTPWVTKVPRNLISKKPYRGVNVCLLSTFHYASSWWLTFNQVKSLGGSVKKGEKSTPVVFYKVYDNVNPETGETDKRFILRFYNVFNALQCDGITVPQEPMGRKFTPLQECECIVDRYIGRGPTITHDANQAVYGPSLDVIHMPSKDSFESPEAYYATLFHEMVHSTGHPSRLNRDGITKFDGFGSHQYSFEELVAECGSAFLCGEAGILNTTLDNSVAYIAFWIKKLQSEPTWIIRAGSKAAAAVDYILNRKADESDKDVHASVESDAQ
jgi:antirestriction protein ArdC